MGDARYVMAVDLGASNGRCVLGRLADGRLSAGEVCRFPNAPVAAGGRVYWDVLAIYERIKQAFRNCAAEGIYPECVGIDSWAQDFALVSGSGLPLCPPRCYRDGYTKELFAEKNAGDGPARLADITGSAPFSGSTLFQLGALLREEPGIAAAARELLFIPNLLYRMMGARASCDCTLASASQLCGEGAGWSRELISEFGLPEVFPPIELPGGLIGECSDEFYRETGCRPKIALVAGHDTASAMYAAGERGVGGELVVGSGTWSMMMCETSARVRGFDPVREPFLNVLGARGERLLLRGATGLWCFQQVKKEWEAQGRFPGYAALEAYALERPARAWFDPDEPSLSWNDGMELEIARLCVKNGFDSPKCEGEYYAVIMNSLARKYAAMKADFERLTGKRFGRVRIVGGGAKDPTLLRLTREHTGCEVAAGPVEASSEGNLRLQFRALGLEAVEVRS